MPRSDLDRLQWVLHAAEHPEDFGNSRSCLSLSEVELPRQEPSHSFARDTEDGPPPHTLMLCLTADAKELGGLGRVPALTGQGWSTRPRLPLGTLMLRDGRSLRGEDRKGSVEGQDRTDPVEARPGPVGDPPLVPVLGVKRPHIARVVPGG